MLSLLYLLLVISINALYIFLIIMNIDPYVKEINRQGLGVEGIIVMQHGEKCAEYRWVPERPKNIHSVSKSFVSIAIGMAVGEGKLRLKDRVLDFFPRQDASPRLQSLSLEHLLTMTRGHREFTRPRTVDEALSHELFRDPGGAFLYDNACTFLASAMLTKAAGQSLRDYLAPRLFCPLGIAAPLWAESDDGFTMGATGLELDTSSLAKFGQFLLQRGVWQGQELVSPLWIDAATRAQVATRNSKPDYNLGYGWQFWICRHGAYRCDGIYGQFVIVIPYKEAVIAINSAEENMAQVLYAVWDHVLPLL
jgi:CubicO group peptidase (beta-lactamase class C family)